MHVEVMPGPVVREQDVILSGTMQKRSRFLGQWRERWVVLTSQFILSYEYPGHERVGHAPTEFLVLKECVTVKSAEEETGKPYAFRVDHPDRTFYLAVNSKEEKEAWIGAVAKAIVRPTMLIDD